MGIIIVLELRASFRCLQGLQLRARKIHLRWNPQSQIPINIRELRDVFLSSLFRVACLRDYNFCSISLLVLGISKCGLLYLHRYLEICPDSNLLNNNKIFQMFNISFKLKDTYSETQKTLK